MTPTNRTALLAGARRCLDRRGYARTTAREVAGEAGVSLAAIGYHFGSTDALLVEALLAGLEEWGGVLDARLDAAGDAAARWDAVVGSFAGYRGVLAASYELIARADDTPEVRDRLRSAVAGARLGVSARLGGVHAADGADVADVADGAGVAAYAVLSGLLVQWLVDPDAVPDGAAIVAGLGALT